MFFKLKNHLVIHLIHIKLLKPFKYIGNFLRNRILPLSPYIYPHFFHVYIYTQRYIYTYFTLYHWMIQMQFDAKKFKRMKMFLCTALFKIHTNKLKICFQQTFYPIILFLLPLILNLKHQKTKPIGENGTNLANTCMDGWQFHRQERTQ